MKRIAAKTRTQPKLYDPGCKADPQLSALAKEINKNHADVERLAGQCLEAARETGELLLKAKAGCGHGRWLAWMKVNVKFSQQTANTYMRLAKHWDQITSAGDLSIRQLSIRQALTLLDRGGLEKSGLVPAADLAAEPEAADPQGALEKASPHVRNGRQVFYTAKLEIARAQQQRWQQMVATARADFQAETDGEAVFRALEAYLAGKSKNPK
jgi:hypothetical protein